MRSIRDIQTELVAAMTPQRKLEVSQALRDSAWKLKAAWIRARNPAATEDAIQDEVRAIFRDVRP